MDAVLRSPADGLTGSQDPDSRAVSMKDVEKTYPIHHGSVTVFTGVNIDIRFGEKVGILGRNGAGKSTLIRLISGTEQPTRGKVTRTMSVSWPLALGGGFQGSLTGIDNVRFISRIYGLDPAQAIDYVKDFSELGKYMNEPVKVYSNGMRARLAFAISMVVDFECFLIDEVIAVGDQRFREKCQTELFERRADRAMIVISHDPDFVRTHCDRAVVIHDKRLHEFPALDEAYSFYHEHIA